MADMTKVSVFHSKPVTDLLQYLQNEITLKVHDKPWSAQRKEDVKQLLFVLYQDTVKEVIAKNVSVNGMEWKNETVETQSQVSSETSKVISESTSNDAEPLDKAKAEQFFLLLQQLEDSIRTTARKRKTHPQKIRQHLDKKMCHEIDHLTLQQQKISNKPREEQIPQEEPPLTNQDFEESLQRTQSSLEMLSNLSKVIPEVQEKLHTLSACIQTDLQTEESQFHNVQPYSKNRRTNSR